MSSRYSLPPRDDDLHNYDDIPMTDFSHPQQNPQQQYQQQQNQLIEAQKMEKKCKKYKWSTYSLGCLLALNLIIVIALGALYGNLKATSQIPKNGIVFTSITPTSIITRTVTMPGKDLSSTQTLPPVTQTLPPETQTLPPLTQTTFITKTEMSHITTEFTKTTVLTTTDTKKITVTPTKDPHDEKRCNGGQQYGGQDLHDINSDYDLLLVDAVQEAVDKGMDIDGSQALDVALRSIFLCYGSHSIVLLEVCQSGFVHKDDKYWCNSYGSIPLPTPTQTDTETTTVTMSSRRNRVVRTRG